MIELPSMAMQWFGVGALFVVLGYLIKFRGWTFLLAGYDSTSPIPDDVIADIAGNTVLRIGIAALILGAVITLADTPSYLPTIFEAAVLLAVARLLYRLHTYTPDDVA